MYETGKTAQVAAEMRNYQLALLGISETRWIQSVGLSRTHAVMTSTESADRMGSTRTMNHHNNLQNQEEKD